MTRMLSKLFLGRNFCDDDFFSKIIWRFFMQHSYSIKRQRKTPKTPTQIYVTLNAVNKLIINKFFRR